MRPSIAVVIPAYNAEATISHAIASALEQSEPPEEIIVVDDGSTDGTAAVVRQWEPRIRVVEQRNQGSAVARQTGTQLATADYIAYLDADDWWPKDKLEISRSLLVREEVDFLLADLQRGHFGDSEAQYLPKNSTFFPWVWPFLETHATPTAVESLYRLPPEAGLKLLLAGFPVFPSTMIAKRRVIHEAGGWDARFRRCQDFDLGLRIARKCSLHYYARVQAILGLHAVNADSSAYLVKQLQGDIRVLLAHIEAEPSGSKYRREAAAALAQKYCGLAYVHRSTGNFPLARDAYRAAIKWPGRRMHAVLRWLSATPVLAKLYENKNTDNARSTSRNDSVLP